MMGSNVSSHWQDEAPAYNWEDGSAFKYWVACEIGAMDLSSNSEAAACKDHPRITTASTSFAKIMDNAGMPIGR